jgi:REP element-mobilizing transposase RayT
MARGTTTRLATAQPAALAQPAQLEMTAIVNAPARGPGRGGKRDGAGRKRTPGRRPSVPHRRRPRHYGANPVHVTLRGRAGLPSFRAQAVHEMFRKALHRQRQPDRRYAASFQVVEFSIQENHLHLVVEAVGRTAHAHDSLRSGVSGLAISFAKRLNRLLGRRGKVWAERWHGRELASPREVRNALVYVFRNVAKHGARFFGDDAVDPLSSAPRFTRWTRPLHWPFPNGEGPWPHARPRTWLLGTGWHVHHGLLDPREARRTGAS